MLKNLLIQNKKAIVNDWTNLILESYPAETAMFLKDQKNQFANPVGHTLSSNSGKIFDELLEGKDFDKISEFLTEIVKIRAIQDFTPSRAISFIYLLKRVIRLRLWKDIKDGELYNDFLDFELKIDQVALIAFDLFMESREKVFQIRVNQVKAFQKH